MVSGEACVGLCTWSDSLRGFMNHLIQIWTSERERFRVGCESSIFHRIDSESDFESHCKWFDWSEFLSGFVNHLFQIATSGRDSLYLDWVREWAFHRSCDSDQYFWAHISNYLIQIGTLNVCCESLDLDRNFWVNVCEWFGFQIGFMNNTDRSFRAGSQIIILIRTSESVSWIISFRSSECESFYLNRNFEAGS